MKSFKKSKCLGFLKGICLSIFLLLLLSIRSSVYSQKQGQALLDSLLEELPKAKEDTNKVNLLSKISREYRNVKPNQGIIYAEKGIALSENLHYKKGMAACLSSYGVNQLMQDNYPKALEYYLKALSINQALGDNRGMANNIGSIGYLYQLQSNYPKALEYSLKALSLYEALNDKSGMANNLGNIAIIYSLQNNYSKSLEYFFKSLSIYESLGDKNGMARNIGNIGNVYWFQNNYPKALEYYFKALSVSEELGDKSSMAINIGNIGNIYQYQINYPKALEFFLKALNIYKSLGNKMGLSRNIMDIGILYIFMSKEKGIQSALKKEYLTKSISKLDTAAKIFKEISALDYYQDAQKSLSEAYELNEQYDKALIAFKEHTKYKDSIYNEEKSKELTRKELDYTYSKREDSLRLESDKKELQLKKEIQLQQLRNEYAKKQAAAKSLQERQKLRYEEELKRRKIESDYKQQQIALEAKHQQEAALAKAAQEKKDALNAAALGNQKTMTNVSLVGVVLLLLVALVSIYAYRQKRKANAEITQEKQRSDALLLNILPEEIAEELKSKGAADAKHFDEVTVLFTDFVNFTRHSERLSPTELVASLNECFTAFDAIIERNGLEKIKTIGDAYMAVCGLPVSDTGHAVKTVRAALEIRDYIYNRNQANGDGFEIRIGLHSGPVVAGIIGVKKFAYDIWGDTVNFASRMESSGEPGKVNISESTYQLVKDQFTFQHRGKINAKNKGEVEMCFVEQ